MDAVNRDHELNRRGRYYSIRFRLEMDDHPFLFQVENGKLLSVTGDAKAPAAFVLKGRGDAWRTFLMDRPPPGYHDVSAMLEQGHLQLEGDPMPWLSNMLYVKGIIAHWRSLHADL
jgi:hypothetical protein